jgi:hypothetical protein
MADTKKHEKSESKKFEKHEKAGGDKKFPFKPFKKGGK